MVERKRKFDEGVNDEKAIYSPVEKDNGERERKREKKKERENQRKRMRVIKLMFSSNTWNWVT